MNLILLSKEDFLSPNKIKLTGRRFDHIKNVLKPRVGDSLTVGKLNGLVGRGKVMGFGKDFLELDIVLKEKPPAALDLIVIMALPRPAMLKRSLQCLASLGVKQIIILNFNRVEKSLWQSSSLKPEAIQEDLILGLEQAKDTMLPEIILEKKFKPFVEDKLPKLIKNRKAFVAHPGKFKTLPKAKGPALLIIGPEGGLVDFEVELLQAQGIQVVSLGSRILRFENALIYAIGKMF